MLRKLALFWLLGSIFAFAGCTGGSDDTVNRYAASVEPGRVSAATVGDTVALELNMEAAEVVCLSESSVEAVSGNPRSYLFSGLSEGSHRFAVTGVDGQTALVYAHVGDRQSQPSRISAVAWEDSAEVVWEAVAGAVGYEVYLSTDLELNYELAGTVPGSSALVSDLKREVTYYFRVVAVYEKKSTRSVKEANLSPFGIKPGYTFGEVTAVTPGSRDTHVRIFKGYEKDSKISFLWDALPGADFYIFYGSGEVYQNYEFIDNVTANNYVLDLPTAYAYFRVTAVIEGTEGEMSQYIPLRDGEGYGINWHIVGGIESVTVNIFNFSNFNDVELACMGVGESEWLTAAVTQTPFTAGWLEAMDYDCKLIATNDDSSRIESDVRRVTVYPYPDPTEYLSVFVRQNTALLVWRVNDKDTSYGVLLSEDGGTTLNLIANGLLPEDNVDMEYLISPLQCEAAYKAYIRIDRDNETKLSSPVTFRVETNYCEEEGPAPLEPGTIIELHPAGTLPAPRTYHRALTYQGKLYVLGGSTGTYVNELWVYDPHVGEEGSWKELTPALSPPTQVHPVWGVIGDKFYLYDGCTLEASNSYTWMYSPENNTWTRLSPAGEAPGPVNGAAHTVYNNKLYMFGGAEKGYIWVYDPYEGAQGTWTRLGTLLDNAVYHKTAVTIHNLIYIYGGSSNVHGREAPNTVWVFDPSTNSFTTREQPATAPRKHMHSATAYDGKMYVWNGGSQDTSYYTNDLYVYDPSEGTQGSWTRIIPTQGGLPSPRRGSIIQTIGDRLYIFGGYSGPYFNDSYVYKP